MEKGNENKYILYYQKIGDNEAYGIAYWILKEGTKNKILGTYIT